MNKKLHKVDTLIEFQWSKYTFLNIITEGENTQLYPTNV